MTFTVGIPILVNSGLFSLGGCMVRVGGRNSHSPVFIRHSLTHPRANRAAVRAGCTPQNLSFRFTLRGEHEA